MVDIGVQCSLEQILEVGFYHRCGLCPAVLQLGHPACSVTALLSCIAEHLQWLEPSAAHIIQPCLHRNGSTRGCESR